MAATSKSSRPPPSSSETASSPQSARERVSTSRTRSPSSPSSRAAASRAESSATGSASAHRPHHSSNPSFSGSQLSAGFLAFFDRTLAGITEPRVRPRQSLSRISTGTETLASGRSSPERGPRSARSASNYAASVGSTPVDGKQSSPTLVGDPPSQPYSETDPTLPQPTHVSRSDNKMHQTSSRLLRMTDDDRPFTKVSVSLFSLSSPPPPPLSLSLSLSNTPHTHPHILSSPFHWRCWSHRPALPCPVMIPSMGVKRYISLPTQSPLPCALQE